MSKINQHLDSNCVTSAATSRCDSDVLVVDSSEDTNVQESSSGKNVIKTNNSKSKSSPGRKKVELKTDKKDKRNRLRLKKKMKSHALYQSLDSGDSSVVEASESEVCNLDDVELVEDVKNNKRVHRSLFSDKDKDSPSCSGVNSKLSKQEDITKRRLSSKKRTASSSELSPYWKQNQGSSDDCIVVSSTPPRSKGLSTSKKLTQQFSPLKRIKLSQSSEATSSSKNHNQGILHKSPVKHSLQYESPMKQSQAQHPVHSPSRQHLPSPPPRSRSSTYTNLSRREHTSPSRPSPSGASHASPYRLPQTPNRTPTCISSPMKSQMSSPALSTASRSSYNSPSKREPYYLANFKLMLLSVLGNDDDKSLFNEEDLAYVNIFKSLSGPAQQLYVRLYQRKHTWIRAAKLDYPKIATDLIPIIAELQDVQLLQGEKDLNDLEEALHLLPAPDIKTLAKSLRVSSASSQKADLVSALLKHVRQQRSIFNVNMKAVVMKKARELLGSCLRVRNEPRTVFSRILLLFSLAVNMEDDDQAGGQTQMQTLLMVNMGRVSYPAYTVFRTRKIFRCREDLIRYEEVHQYDQDIQTAMGTNDFELALQILQAAKDKFKVIQEDEDISRHNQSLPPFLRHFTASWMYTRLLFTGVEIHQKMRCYGDAVSSLRSLLGQTDHCMDSRGRWYDRLALNLDQHLKKPNEALDAILTALADPCVKLGHRLALQQRAQKIFKSRRNSKLLEREEEFTFDELREIPKVTISGQVLPFQAPGVKNTFVRRLQTGSPSSGRGDTDMAICSVENVALQHYKDSGYEEGVHGESSVFTTLIFLLFWDVVFMSGIPDVFSYPYQSAPLDIRYSSFYECRQDTIDEKLQELSQKDIDALQTALETSWKEHEGENCVGVSWELFRDIEHAKGLLACLGGKTLCAIADRILKNHRHTRAGMPDLTVWSIETNKYKVVEVKGPGDRLSQKQILWIDYLLGLGVDTEVCHVQASGKRLRMT